MERRLVSFGRYYENLDNVRAAIRQRLKKPGISRNEQIEKERDNETENK
jgi:hypothetical protein